MSTIESDEPCKICQNVYNLSIEATLEQKILRFTLKLRNDQPNLEQHQKTKTRTRPNLRRRLHFRRYQAC